ncbi:hypothetical protein [Persicobacter psychrovividus]|uniref:Uncharacterized protein n=1 Tax=Persicobacter psychrovividus TaxID=387638 RepID=A0ABN6LCY9_9BACT|nr:hypothetical protein PEPS_15470 [Persicobacter psychrovividus]
MKAIKILVALFLLSGSAYATTPPSTANEVVAEANMNLMIVSFDHTNNELVISDQQNTTVDYNTMIDLNKANDLAYRTRIYRYFGGLLKAETEKFATIRYSKNGSTTTVPFTRQNLSQLVEKAIN